MRSPTRFLAPALAALLALQACDKSPSEPPANGSPSIQITTGAGAQDLATNQAAFAVQGAAADDKGVVRVEWSSNRGGSGTATGTASWSASVALQEGANLITVTAFDEEGESASATLPVMLDTQAPTLEIGATNLERSVATAAATYALAGVAADNHAIERVEWSTSRGASGAAGGTTSWTATAALQPGDNVVTVTVRDRAGNTASDRLTVTYNQGAQLAQPTVNPGGVLVGAPAQVRVTVPLSGATGLVASSVRLVRVSESGAVTGQVGTLVDNGNLSQGDEILGDGVFSGVFSFNESATGNVRLRVTAQTQNGGTTSESLSPIAFLVVYTAISTAELQQVTSVQQNAVAQVRQAAGQGFTQGMQRALEWLRTQPEVASARLDGDDQIAVEYKSGLLGGIKISRLDAEGGVSRDAPAPAPPLAVDGGAWNGGPVPSASFASSADGGWGFGGWTVQADTPRPRTRAPGIPVSRQTRGTAPALSVSAAGGPGFTHGTSPDAVLSRNVLIYAPFEFQFAPHNEGDALKALIAESDLRFTVTHLRNTAANVAALRTMASYGLVVLATHGASGEYIWTGQRSTTANLKTHEALLRARQLGIFTAGTFQTDSVAVTGEFYVANSRFVLGLGGKFPRSIIINNSCESTQTARLRNAFLARGALTYFGYTKVVGSRFAKERAVDLVTKLVKDLKTAGESFVPDQADPRSPNAVFQMFGNDKAHFAAGLVNGDLEFGTLAAWNPVGDGRVITRLGSQAPTGGGYMAIVSTGLGFTTATGEIRQTFRVNAVDSLLTFRWNFLSEEFLEYVGSQYQDYFRVVLEVDGAQHVLFSRNIDQFASQYTLTQVSPGIVFDRGGVYMTGWRSASFDVRAYRGKAVTLRFLTGDIGDSIYDSAVLIDDVHVQ